MSNFIYTVLTAEGCGHCKHARGDGVLGNGKQFLQYDYISSLIKPDKNKPSITLLNIHFMSMNGSQNQIKDISKLYLVKDSIYQEKYQIKDDKAYVEVRSMKKNNSVKDIKNQFVKIDNKELKWQDFVNKKISKKIENYTFYYPCFVMFRREDWVKGEDFLGITNAGITIKDFDGEYKLEKNPRSLNERNVDPVEIAKKAVMGELDFSPLKILNSGKKTEATKEKKTEATKEKKTEATKEKKTEATKEKKSNKLGFIILNYDDDF